MGNGNRTSGYSNRSNHIVISSSLPTNWSYGTNSPLFYILKKKPKLTLYFDPTEPQIDSDIFNNNISPFKEHYRDTADEVPFKMPEPVG